MMYFFTLLAALIIEGIKKAASDFQELSSPKPSLARNAFTN
jgi:hypothetical protein